MIVTINKITATVGTSLPPSVVYPFYDACSIGTKVVALTTRGYMIFDTDPVSGISVSASGTSLIGSIICPVDSASALVVSDTYNTGTGTNTSASVSIFNINNKQYSTISAASSLYASYAIPGNKAQQSASYGGVCLVTNASSQTITRYENYGLTRISLPFVSGNVSCITNIGSNFLIGSSTGQIMEITSSGTLVKQLFITSGIVTGLSVYSNYIGVSIGASVYSVNWNTLTVSGAISSTTLLTPSSSGVCGTQYGELVLTENPIKYTSQIPYPNTSGNTKLDDSLYGMLTGGFISGTDLFWAVTGGGYYNTVSFNYDCRIALYRFVPTPKVNKLSALVVNGRHVACRKIVMIDDGTVRIESDVLLPDYPVYVPVSSGKSIIEIVLYKDGMLEKGSVSFYNT